jgi:hypothetical protein
MTYDGAVASILPNVPLRWKFDEAAGNATRKNYSLNPSAEVNISNVNAYTNPAGGIVSSSDRATVGTKSFQITAPTGAATAVIGVRAVGLTVPAGTTVTAACDVFIPAGLSQPLLDFQIILRDDPAGINIAAPAQSIPANSIGSWKRYALTYTIDAGRTLTSAYFVVRLVNWPAPTDQVWFDAIMVGSEPYFDGSSPRSGGFRYSWDGGAGVSSSTATLGTTAFNSGTAGASADMFASATGMNGQPGLITVGNSWKFSDGATPTFASSPIAGSYINGWTAFTAVLWAQYDQAGGLGNDFLIDASSSTITGGVSIRKPSNNTNVVAILDTTGGSARVDTAGNSFPPNVPAMIAVTWASGSDIKVYINGVDKTNNVLSGGIRNPSGTLINPNELYLGRWKAQTDGNLSGWLDDVALAPKYLSDAEAYRLYMEGIGQAREGSGATSALSGLASAGYKVGIGVVDSTLASDAVGVGAKQGVGLGTTDSSPAVDGAGTKTGLGTAGVTTGITNVVGDGERALPPERQQELNVMRNLTEVFINTMPVDLLLIPRTRVSDGMGGYTWSDQSPRAPQTMRLIEYSNDATAPEPVLTSDGHQRYVQYELLAKWDAEIGIWDHFTHDGDEWEVVEVYFNNGWEYRAKVARFGNGGKP